MTLLICLLALWIPASAPAATGLGEGIALYERGDFGGASAFFSRVGSAQPSAEVSVWLGRTQLKLRRWDEAVRTIEAAARLEPQVGRHRLWLARAYGRKAEHTVFFMALSLARNALREFEAAVKLAPADLEAKFDLIEYYSLAPGIAGGDRDKAWQLANGIAQVQPRMGYPARALIYEADKKWDKARGELEQAAAKFESDPSTHADLALFHLRRSEYEFAARRAQIGLKLGTSARLLFASAAASVRLLRDLNGAESTLLELARGPLKDEDPSFAEVYFWLAECQLALGKAGPARQALEKSLGYDPDFAPARSLQKRMRSAPSLHEHS